MMNLAMRVLVLTNQWPTSLAPEKVPFIVQQIEDLRRAGVEMTVFAFTGRMNPASYLSAWRRLRREVDFSTFNLIHAQFGQSGLLALPRRLPLVVTFRGSDLLGIVGENGRYTFAGRVNRMVSQLVARRADALIVVAEHLKPYLPVEKPVYTITGGINIEMFQPLPLEDCRQQLGLPKNRRLVLFAGDPDRAVKRYQLAQQAVTIAQSSIDFDLVTISKVPHEQVPMYMNGCDLLLLTSRHEGSPNVVKEALACNLPVVSVDVGDVRQHLEGLPGCVLCQDDSPEAIAEALVQALTNINRTTGRKRMEPFALPLTTSRIISIYESVL